MVKDNQFKPTFKQPFIPQTETRIFLGGRPIEQQMEQTSLSSAARSKVINRSGGNYLSSWAETDISEAIGYGPVFPDYYELKSESKKIQKENEKELERSNFYCEVCHSKAPMFREYCDEHYPPYIEQREKFKKQDRDLLKS